MISKKRVSSIWYFVGGLAVILILFFGLIIYCSSENRKLRTYSFTSEQLDVAQDGLSLRVTRSKHWKDVDLHPKNPDGGQYDGYLSNDSQLIFRDWSVTMTFSEDCKIDSSWNGEFSAEGKAVTFVATDDVLSVPAGDEASFGAVLYAPCAMKLCSYTLQGYRIINVLSLPLFWILIFLFVAWFFVGVMNIIISLETKKFKERQKLDMIIISQSINTFTGFIDAKDKYTKGHSARVAEYSEEIARRMKIPEDEVCNIYQVALMHDCGKIGIPDSVLKKPGSLTVEEYELIKSHTTLGDELLANFTAIPGIRDGAHYHHERYDGMGYPSGLAGTDIPLYARIICVADSFDAMSSNRCYRQQLSHDKIVSELNENAGKQFDPELVTYMLEMMEDGFVSKVREQLS